MCIAPMATRKATLARRARWCSALVQRQRAGCAWWTLRFRDAAEMDARAARLVCGRTDACHDRRLFSSGTPTLGLGYTDKAEGVFTECGIAGDVADLRKLDARALSGRAVASYTARQDRAADLAARVAGLARPCRIRDGHHRASGGPVDDPPRPEGAARWRGVCRCWPRRLRLAVRSPSPGRSAR